MLGMITQLKEVKSGTYNTCILLVSETFLGFFFKGQILPGGPKWNSPARHVQSDILQMFVEAPSGEKHTRFCFLLTYFESLMALAPVSQWPVHRILLRACRG